MPVGKGGQKVRLIDLSIPIRSYKSNGPIDRSFDTNSIFQKYRPIQSVNFRFQFLYQTILMVRFKSDSFINQSFLRFKAPIFVLGLKLRFLYWAIVLVGLF